MGKEFINKCQFLREGPLNGLWLGRLRTCPLRGRSRADEALHSCQTRSVAAGCAAHRPPSQEIHTVREKNSNKEPPLPSPEGKVPTNEPKKLETQTIKKDKAQDIDKAIAKKSIKKED